MDNYPDRGFDGEADGIGDGVGNPDGLDGESAELQDLPWDGTGPPDYDRIVRDMSARNSFRAFIGVFASGLKTRRSR